MARQTGGTVPWNGRQVPVERFEGGRPGAAPIERQLKTELSGREAQVLWMYGGRGMATKQVALRLGISEETTKSYIKRVREKLRAKQLDADVLSIEVGNKRGLYLAALDECRHLPDCQEERDRLLRRLLSTGAPELATGGLVTAG